MQQSFEYQVVRKNLELEFNISPDIPIVLVGDSARLSQILINLIGNAVKFTDKGKVLVEAYMLASQGNKVDVGIRVTDTGIGIDEDKLQVIFESFTQASSSTTRNYGGTGLGLAITKKLVELQGGVLEVKSRIGKGSIFSFVLSFIRSEKDHLEEDMLIKANFQSLAGLKVLVVEDNLVNQKIVCKFLMKWKVNVDVAENGRIAVEKAAKQMYDLVLMDLHMPEMNGYDATRLIRQMDGDQYKELPIIALTASAFIEDREKIYSYGMSGYIIKPFNPSELYWKIAPYIKT